MRSIMKKTLVFILLILFVFSFGNCNYYHDEKEKKENEKRADNADKIMALIIWDHANPRFVYSCDFIVASGKCMNLNTNTAPYDCTGYGGTVSSDPCPCNGAVVGSCKFLDSFSFHYGTDIYYSNNYDVSSASTDCANKGGQFTTSCLTQ